MASVTIRDIYKSYGSVPVLHGVDIDMEDGEFVVLVGPSGCGKSTLLRMIAGLEEITAGDILIGDRVVNSLPPKDRDIAMVFQNYALYPHMSVLRNMGFSMEIRRAAGDLIGKAVNRAASILGLSELLARLPRELSGGQRQRVAMGRAIVRQPQVFLFDEPLSNLDAKLRVQMRTEIKALHQDLRTTAVYVTHDQVEAMTMADRIVVMHDGLIQQIGGPLDIYDHPANRFVAGFIGSPAMNFFDGIVQRDNGTATVQTPDGHSLPMPAIIERSCWSRRFAIVQPWPGLPTRLPAGTRTSWKKVWQNGEEPLIKRIGETVTPGDSMSNSRKLMPSCLGASGSVRTRQKIQSDASA